MYWHWPCIHNAACVVLRQLNSTAFGFGIRKPCGVMVGRGWSTSTSPRPSRVKEILDTWTRQLEKAEVPEARLAAEHIIAHTLRLPRVELNKRLSTVLSEERQSEVERLMTCRLARMPLQYILGEWDFRDITLKLQPPVFIPRPETEQLVDLALECLVEVERPRVLEIGCGSGAVSISLLHSRQDLVCVAVDQSRSAINLTERNAREIGVRERLTLVEGKVTSEASLPLPHTTYNLVVANPPYVLRKDLMNLQPEIMMYEDLRALDGGREGLDVIKDILHLAHSLLPHTCPLLLEVDPCHPYLIPTWLQQQTNLKIKLSKVYQDFCQKDRFIKFVKCS